MAIAGKYRGGKSYVLNHLINQPGCFGVGNTTNACTKGLWIWNKVVKAKTQDGKDLNVVLIDTEGLGDTEKDQNNDVRIFMLAVLLSSHIIFNCTGVIDNDSISQLSLVSQMTNRIRLSNADKHSNPDEVEPEEFAQFFPDITLLVRDFFL